MGSVVFTWGPFEVELVARPITISSPCFALDNVKINECVQKINLTQKDYIIMKSMLQRIGFELLE